MLGKTRFIGKPVGDFKARVFGKFEELQASFGFRLTEPGYFGADFDSLSGFRRLDAQAYASFVEGID
ncbi:MAG: hypothetical protein WA212_19575, partial [Candidatus Acidiferrales bacterium]